MTDPVGDQYQGYPYPARDPADEAKRLVRGSPSRWVEIQHYVFAGRRDPAAPFRALVAGGGTGDGAIMLAQELAERSGPGEVIHLDPSAAAAAVAVARAEARGLRNLRFHQGSLLELGGLGAFDYIDCCGVLHHLADPAAGLSALAAALAPGGGIGLMVYGALGRTGVYPAQAALRLLAGPGVPAPARLETARAFLADLPPTNWLRRNPHLHDHLQGGDAGLFDLLLHARDRAYTVPAVQDLLAQAGLRARAFIEPVRYDPLTYLADPALRARAAALSASDQASLAELIAGNLRKHIVYAVRAETDSGPARPAGPGTVLVLRDGDGPALGRGLAGGGRLKVDLDGIGLRVAVDAAGARLLTLLDGRRSLGDVRQLLAGDALGEAFAFQAACDRLYAALGPLNLLLVARAG
ncbi:MAG: methyltransferase [Alphaproteobacteria bacterium]|nr:methyltransferase [Alphaproteobacteria bacterium]